MINFVLDCSMTMAWCFEDERTSYTEQVLESLSQDFAIVPALWSYEVANTLLVAERKQRISPADSTHFLDLLSKLSITVLEKNHHSFKETLMNLARNYHLSAYDAVYLNLAMSQGLALATLDYDLQKACKNVGVKLYQP